MTRSEEWLDVWWGWVSSISWQIALFVTLVTLATMLAKHASPRLRHAVWLLVLIKVFLPTTASAPWSVGNWYANPLPTFVGNLTESTTSLHTASEESGIANSPSRTRPIKVTSASLFMAWVFGVVITTAIIAVLYVRLCRRTSAMPVADEGPPRVALERAALRLKMLDPPEIRVTEQETSPFLIGVLRPRIVISRTLINDASENELETVFLHELIHCKHKDTWIGWLQCVSQCLLWFHPFVWFANSRLSHERESVCDEAVLRSGGVDPDAYGETLLRVLTVARGRSAVRGSLVGVFEQGGRMQNRLETVMKFDSKRQSSVWAQRLAVGVFAMMFLPMAPGNSTSKAAAPQATAENASTSKAAQPPTPYPQIAKTTPEIGATGVDPGVTEIRVTFDRDMSQGMSWAGGGPEFPPVDKSRKAEWVDKRTCILPVTLKRGGYYRVGINSKSHQNFKAANGTATPPAAIFFTTKGATKAQENRVRIPSIVEMTPANDAKGVSPATRQIRVTFNMPMGDGMSWTGGGDAFPKVADGQKPTWSKDGRTCTLPVSLQPDHEYRLGLNSLSHNNFQSKWGVPLSPIVYSFRTAAK